MYSIWLDTLYTRSLKLLHLFFHIESLSKWLLLINFLFTALTDKKGVRIAGLSLTHHIMDTLEQIHLFLLSWMAILQGRFINKWNPHSDILVVARFPWSENFTLKHFLLLIISDHGTLLNWNFLWNSNDTLNIFGLLLFVTYLFSLGLDITHIIVCVSWVQRVFHRRFGYLLSFFAIIGKNIQFSLLHVPVSIAYSIYLDKNLNIVIVEAFTFKLNQLEVIKLPRLTF